MRHDQVKISYDIEIRDKPCYIQNEEVATFWGLREVEGKLVYRKGIKSIECVWLSGLVIIFTNTIQRDQHGLSLYHLWLKSGNPDNRFTFNIGLVRSLS